MIAMGWILEGRYGVGLTCFRVMRDCFNPHRSAPTRRIPTLRYPVIEAT
jgi:hypothetical protein